MHEISKPMFREKENKPYRQFVAQRVIKFNSVCLTRKRKFKLLLYGIICAIGFNYNSSVGDT